jgi:hypothetical protein
MKDQVKRIIHEFVRNYMAVTQWNDPLVAFAGASDPLFSKLREVDSPYHAMHDEILPGARTVIAYFLPFESQFP